MAPRAKAGCEFICVKFYDVISLTAGGAEISAIQFNNQPLCKNFQYSNNTGNISSKFL
jgi:hypothetical protein